MGFLYKASSHDEPHACTKAYATYWLLVGSPHNQDNVDVINPYIDHSPPPTAGDVAGTPCRVVAIGARAAGGR